MELQKIIYWNKNILTEEEIDKLLNNENIEIENLGCLDKIGE